MISFDNTADLTAHLPQLKQYIAANVNCSTINNITFVSNNDIGQWYSGTFDTRVLAFVKKAKGFVNAAPITLIKAPADPNATTSHATHAAPANNRTLVRRSLSRRAPAAEEQDDAPW